MLQSMQANTRPSKKQSARKNLTLLQSSCFQPAVLSSVATSARCPLPPLQANSPRNTQPQRTGTHLVSGEFSCNLTDDLVGIQMTVAPPNFATEYVFIHDDAGAQVRP